MQEIVRNYHNVGGNPRCAIKVDLQKAYDLVQWQFLFDALSAMQFPDLMIGWIKECVCTVHFSISMNGFLDGYFDGEQGLRGDLISLLSLLISNEGILLCFEIYYLK